MDRAVPIVTGPNAPAAARERAAEFFSDSVAAEQAERLRLLVSEIVNEAVERAAGRRRVLQLHLERHAELIHVEVTQTGPPANGHESREIRERIFDRTATRWGADEAQGGRLWFELDA